MKILMYGWEFPPKNSGGLGVACKGIVDGLVHHGVYVNLVLPYTASEHRDNYRIINSNRQITQIKVPAELKAYSSPEDYLISKMSDKDGKLYSDDLFTEVAKYKHTAGRVANEVDHEVIHAHDWMTYPAAIEAKKHSGKPFVAHIHATEYDRSGENPHPLIRDIEKMGFEHADKIIAVSEFTKRKIIEHYQIDPDKITVIHNAVCKKFQQHTVEQFQKNRKNVLFLGRITMQKGPEYYLQAAKRVLEVEPNTNFLMAGDGDMMGRMIQLSLDLGIQNNVLFTGFLRGSDIDKAFQSATVFVMPSVSEPFGLVALEAIRNGTPVLASYQSGVAEAIPNMLKVDFWDIEEMANKIVACLRYQPLTDELRYQARRNLDELSWQKQAHHIKKVYHSLTP